MFENITENLKKGLGSAWELVKSAGKTAYNIAKGFVGGIKEEATGLYKWGKGKITGEQIEGARSPIEILGGLTWQPVSRLIGKTFLTGLEKLTGADIKEVYPTESKIAKFLFGKQPLQPFEKEWQSYKEWGKQVAGEKYGSAFGTMAFLGFTALDAWVPFGGGRTFLRREILKEIARTTDKNAIKDLLLKEIPELHHSSLIGKVDSIAEKLVQANKPSLVRKTLQQEFDNIAKEMGVDLARVRKEMKEVKPEPEVYAPITPSAVGEFVGIPSKRSVAINLPETRFQELFTNLKASKPESVSTILNISPSNFTNISFIQSYINKVQKISQESLPAFKQYLQEATGKIPDVRVKQADSILGKIERYLLNGKNPAEIADILAGRIVVDSSEIPIQLQNIKRNFNVTEIQDFFKNPTEFGYTGINIKVKLPNGFPAEIQIHTPQSLEALNKIHPIYEKWRNRDLSKLSLKEKNDFLADLKKSQQLAQAAKGMKEVKPEAVAKTAAEGIKEPPPPKPPRNPPLDNIHFRPEFNEQGMKNYRIRGTFKNFWENKPGFKERTQQILDECSIYYPEMSNKEIIDKAVAELKQLDVDEAYKQWSKKWQRSYPRDPGRLAIERVKATILSDIFWDLKQHSKAMELTNWVVESGTELGRAVEIGKALPKISHSLYSPLYRAQAPRRFEAVLRELVEKKGIKVEENFIKDAVETVGKIHEKVINPKELEKHFENFIRKTVAPQLKLTPRETFDILRYSNMLWGPITQLRNALGNFTQLFVKNIFVLPVQAVIEYMKHPFKPALREVVFSDIPLVWKKTIGSLDIAVNTFWQVLKGKEGISQKWLDVLKSKDAFESMINYYRYTEATPFWLKVAKTPLNFLEASDRFFSTLIAAGEEARLTTLYERAGKKLTETARREIAERAQEVAETYLFRRSLGFKREELNMFSQALDALGESILNLRNKWYNSPNKATRYLLGYPFAMFVPFLQTPINIGIMMSEFSPLGLIRNNYTSEKLAQAFIGSVFTLWGAMKALNGETTWLAPSDKKEKAIFYESRKPFSININGVDIPFLYFGPLGLAMAVPAAIVWALRERQPKWSPGLDEALTASALQVLRFLSSQTSLQGLNTWSSVISGEEDFNFFGGVGYTLGQLIPMQGFLKWVGKIVDPVYRKAGVDFMGSIKDSIPFLRKTMEAYENVGGEADYHWTTVFTPYGTGHSYAPLNVALKELEIDKRRRKAWDFYVKNKLKLEDVESWVGRLKKIEGKPLKEDDIKKGMEIIEALGSYEFKDENAKNAALYFTTVFLEQLANENREQEFREVVSKIPKEYKKDILRIRDERKTEKELPIFIPYDVSHWSTQKKAELLYKYFTDLAERGISNEDFKKIQRVLRKRGVLTKSVADILRSLMEKQEVKPEAVSIK